MPTLDIDPNRVMQSFVHDHKRNEWYVAQAGVPDTILTRCDKDGKRISQAILKSGGHGTSISISHDKDGEPLIWLWWNGTGPVTFSYAAGTHEHTSPNVTRLHNIEHAYTVFAVDEGHNLVATRTSDAKSAQRFTLRNLDDYLAGVDKPIHRTGLWANDPAHAFQGFAINGASEFWVALGGNRQTTDVRRYTWDAVGWGDGARHSTADLGPSSGYHEAEGIAFGSLGGLWVGIATGTNAHRVATAHQLIAPAKSEPPPAKGAPMKIIQIPTKANSSRQGYDIGQIVIHTMEAPESEGRAVWCGHYFADQGLKLQASAGYMLDDKDVVQGVPDSRAAWACPFFNLSGLQFEHAGYAGQSAGDWQDDYSQRMLHLSAQLAAVKATQYGIPVRRLTLAQVRTGTVKGFLGHWDATRAGVGGNTHTDPGPNFPWRQYLDLVKAYQAGKAPTPAQPVTHGKPAPLTVDGVFGTASTAALFYLAGVDDGSLQITGQARTIRTSDAVGTALDVCWPTLTYGTGGSQSIAWLQQQAGADADGQWGPNSREACQRMWGVTPDGTPGTGTTKAAQSWINTQLKEK